MICPFCGKEFQPHRKAQVTCGSYSCRRKYAHRNTHSISEKAVTWKPVCQYCGKVFKPHYHGEHFCSDDCRFHFFHMEHLL